MIDEAEWRWHGVVQLRKGLVLNRLSTLMPLVGFAEEPNPFDESLLEHMADMWFSNHSKTATDSTSLARWNAWLTPKQLWGLYETFQQHVNTIRQATLFRLTTKSHFGMGVRKWAVFETVPTKQQVAQLYLFGRSSQWLMSQLCFHWIPSGRKFATAVLSLEEGHHFQVEYKLAPAMWRGWDALVKTTVSTKTAVDAWKDTVTAMARWVTMSREESIPVFERIHWPVEVAAELPTNRILYAPMWTALLMTDAPVEERICALMRVLVTVTCYRLVERPWMMDVDNRVHTKLTERLLKKKAS